MAHKQKILIVEDNADGRELFALYIRRLGYEVFEAARGLEALDQAHAVHPDLILMDLALPKMPGYEATARLNPNSAVEKSRGRNLGWYGVEKWYRGNDFVGMTWSLVGKRPFQLRRNRKSVGHRA